MKKLLSILLTVLLLALSIASISVSAVEPDTAHPIAKAAYGTPTIDGEIDDIWATAEVNEIAGAFAEGGPDPANPRNGTSATFRALWDNRKLYLLVEVVDSTIGDENWELQSVGAGSLWKRNSVSFAFTPDYNRDVTTTQVAPSFWFLLSCMANGGEEYVAGDGTANFNNVDREVFRHFKAKLTDTGYLIEIAVDLSLVYSEIAMAEGTCIGFDIYVNDNIPIIFDTRVIGLRWNDINSYKNNSLKGTIQLVKGGAAEETTTAAPETTTAAPETTAAPAVTTAPTTTAAPAETPKTADTTLVLVISTLMLGAAAVTLATAKKRG